MDAIRGPALAVSSIHRSPAYASAHAGLSLVYSYSQIYGFQTAAEILQRAESTAERALALDDSLAEAHTALGCVVYASGGEAGTLKWYVDQFRPLAERDKIDGRFVRRAQDLALLCARLDAVDEALDWLDQVIRQRVNPVFLKLHPWLDSVRSHPRFAEMLERMRLD